MNVQPLVNVLRQTHHERLATDESIQLSYERIVNNSGQNISRIDGIDKKKMLLLHLRVPT